MELWILIICIFLLIASLACLGIVFALWSRIKKLEEKTKLEAVERVIKADNYIKSDMEFDGKTYEFFRTTNKNNEVVGYAFTLSSNGYGGAVKSVVGIDKKGKVTAVEIIDVSNETPGLGKNAAKEDFSKQFKNKNAPLEVVKSDPKENEIQAVTGATITSRAVTNSVNLALELFSAIEKEGGK